MAEEELARLAARHVSCCSTTRAEHLPGQEHEHCVADDQPWPCDVSRLLATLDARELDVERLDYDATWRKFEAYEAKATKHGSGMTRDQMTGASMMLGWITVNGASLARPEMPETSHD